MADKEEEKIKEPEQWQRPDDIKRYTTSDPQKMIGMYLVKNAVREWAEDFVDQGTGKTVKVPRQEIIKERGRKLSAQDVADISFYLQTGDCKGVTVAEENVAIIKDYICSSFLPWQVTFNGNANTKQTYLARAQYPQQAIEICRDFGSVYRGLQWFVPLKIVQLNTNIIEDNDECIPEKARIARQVYKEYYKVGVRLQWYDDSTQKNEKSDREFIINANELGEAKIRVARYCRKLWKELLEGPENTNNELIIRKGVPISIDCLVPAEYSLMYRQEPDW